MEPFLQISSTSELGKVLFKILPKGRAPPKVEKISLLNPELGEVVGRRSLYTSRTNVALNARLLNIPTTSRQQHHERVFSTFKTGSRKSRCDHFVFYHAGRKFIKKCENNPENMLRIPGKETHCGIVLIDELRHKPLNKY